MNEDKTERWQDLCKQAENEKDPVRLLALVQEINRLLEVRTENLKASHMRIKNKEITDPHCE